MTGARGEEVAEQLFSRAAPKRADDHTCAYIAMPSQNFPVRPVVAHVLAKLSTGLAARDPLLRNEPQLFGTLLEFREWWYALGDLHANLDCHWRKCRDR